MNGSYLACPVPYNSIVPGSYALSVAQEALKECLDQRDHVGIGIIPEDLSG